MVGVMIGSGEKDQDTKNADTPPKDVPIEIVQSLIDAIEVGCIRRNGVGW